MSDATENKECQHLSLDKLQEIDSRCGIGNYGRLPLALERGEGVRVWDFEGREYLDFLGGIAVVTLGHNHFDVTRAIASQAARMIHSSNLFYIEPQVRLAQRLYELSDGLKAFFCNSGAEANEAAIKVARKYYRDQGSPRFEVISVTGSFHGRTYATLAATGQPKYHAGFDPMPAGFLHVTANDFPSLEKAISTHTAAVILEAIQGESGVIPCNEEYLKSVRELCNRHGILLIFDEVQCGMGRTGKFFAHQWANVKGDIVTMAKGLANGVPIGAMLAREDVAASLVPGTHGCTFGGNYLSASTALVTLEVLQRDNLMEHAFEVGEYLQQRLRLGSSAFTDTSRRTWSLPLPVQP